MMGKAERECQKSLEIEMYKNVSIHMFMRILPYMQWC
jgi:hypothetical protein